MPKKLLLADDSITIQRVVGITFANEDFEITTVDNGEDAVLKAKEIGPDIILADVIMPKLNGYEVCRTVKADARLRHIPVLLLAGTFEAFDENRAREVGADGHITKPFESQALIDRVKQMLSGAPAPAAPKPQPAAVPRPVAAPVAPAVPPPAPRPVVPPVAPRPIPTPAAPVPRPVTPPAAAVPPAGVGSSFAPPPAPRPAPAPFAAPPVAQPMPPPQAPRPFAPPPAAVPPPPSAFAPMVTPPPVAPPTPKPFQPEPAPVPPERPSMPSPFDLEPAEPAGGSPLSSDSFESAPAEPEPLAPPAFSEPPAFTPPAPREPSFSFEPSPPPPAEPAEAPLEPAPIEPEPLESASSGFGDFGAPPTEPALETQPGTLADLTEPAPAPADAAEMPAVDIDEEGMAEEPTPLAPMHEFIPTPEAVGHVPEKRKPVPEKAPADEEAVTQPPVPTAPAAAPSLSEDQLRALAREVIEKAVWEIVPQLAETILREEIEKLVQKKLAE